MNRRYLNPADLDSLRRGTEHDLDVIDAEINGLHRIRHRELRAGLEQLGFDVTHYNEPPRLHRLETRSHFHREPLDPWLARAIAQASKRGHLVRTCGEVTGIR